MRIGWIAAAAGGLGALAAGLLSTLPAPAGLAAVGLLLCWLGFALWPWAVLPVGIIGGTLAGALIGGGSVQAVVATQLLILGTGGAAVLTRWLLLPGEPPRRRTVADGAMAGLAVLAVLAAVYGLARGNAPERVAVTTYQFGVIPTYFFLATGTLRDDRELRNAGLLYVSACGLLTLAGLTAPDRHGGLIPLIAVPPLIVAIGRTGGWLRAGAALLAALFVADVVLASYRGIWVAAGIAGLVLALRGRAAVRRGLAGAAAGLAVLGIVLITLVDLSARSTNVAEALRRSAGHRASEAAVGLTVFTDNPLLGAGLGQSTPDIYLPGFTVTDVGPVYHAFYVMILANVGLVGMCVVLWPLLRALRAGLGGRHDLALAFSGLTCGFLAAAVFASPTGGHWELGLLPALTLLTLQHTGDSTCTQWTPARALPIR
ncbi:O-antigen ligase family protein [Dactylosporangium sp. CA-092794]|uniref:O-antigen ligase family protein n=1 Tax=Dactylosporangium sp. CA-092794 TaxID=3239929 RepID=UPI003D89CD07